jgi:glutamine amidotransferase
MTTIIDYGMGNLHSLQNALSHLGEKSITSSDPEVIRTANNLMLPGVGSFGQAMRNINSKNLHEAIHEAVISRAVPFLGICLGMQLLAFEGEEEGNNRGLGLIEGSVKKLKGGGLRLPHIGFNAVHVNNTKGNLYMDIPDGSDFYFVHSYHFECNDLNNVLGTTEYGSSFVSSVQKNNIYGVQFHPEKSQTNGLKLLSNFLKIRDNL